MERVLCGIETEYGLWIEGRGPENQIEDAQRFVECYPSPRFVGWDYRFESPRRDLRGFSVDQLAVDPEDMKFERGKTLPPAHVLRADRITRWGDRFYNDHGHPEWSTAERFCPVQAADQDLRGEGELLATLKAFRNTTDREVQVYKNNTDFQKASYGTHESYLVSRSWGFGRLYEAITPVLVARLLLTGAGKSGSEYGDPATFQASQRADFFVEPANVETLYRRPVFNTRDEPHARDADWIRLHVISGDANRMHACTARKMALISWCLRLEAQQRWPRFSLAEPVRTFERLSKNPWSTEPLGGFSAQQVLETLLESTQRWLELSESESQVWKATAEALELWRNRDAERLARTVDWAAKQRLLQYLAEEEGLAPNAPELKSYDLEYSNIDPEQDLFRALVEMDWVDPNPDAMTEWSPTRADLRAWILEQWPSAVETLSWGTVTLKNPATHALETLSLPPDLQESDMRAIQAAGDDVQRGIALIRALE